MGSAGCSSRVTRKGILGGGRNGKNLEGDKEPDMPYTQTLHQRRSRDSAPTVGINKAATQQLKTAPHMEIETPMYSTLSQRDDLEETRRGPLDHRMVGDNMEIEGKKDKPYSHQCPYSTEPYLIWSPKDT
ncbi:hypothetical protein PR048_007078 [Dryococelus australis]|uniref:Prolactin receptor n=1 Tax=Dryococelus australis TaxID=614101 RepID=A0ABQ9ICM2_9NEOP|nr:hypothetical protein PR048_007078 [Dryococelus australis]